MTQLSKEQQAAIIAAAEKLVRCKGRFHSEQNYRALAALFGVTVPDLPPLAAEAQEPVAYMYRDNLHADARFSLEPRFGNWSPEDINEYEITETKLYAAPQPVAVPDDYFSSLVAAARARADKAMRKFPQPNYVLNKVAEESGEVIKAVIHFTEGREEWANVESEIIDNLAMLIRLVQEGDQVIGFTPPDACRV